MPATEIRLSSIIYNIIVDFYDRSFSKGVISYFKFQKIIKFKHIIITGELSLFA